MIYFLFVLSTEGYVATDTSNLMSVLNERGYEEITYVPGRPHLLRAVHTEDTIVEALDDLVNDKPMSIEAHADEESGNTRMKYTYHPDVGWDISSQLPLFPAKQLLDFV